MSLTQLLACSMDSGVVLSLCGDKIAASPKHRLTDHLRTLVASHRGELIEHLQEQQEERLAIMLEGCGYAPDTQLPTEVVSGLLSGDMTLVDSVTEDPPRVRRLIGCGFPGKPTPSPPQSISGTPWWEMPASG